MWSVSSARLKVSNITFLAPSISNFEESKPWSCSVFCETDLNKKDEAVVRQTCDGKKPQVLEGWHIRLKEVYLNCLLDDHRDIELV